MCHKDLSLTHTHIVHTGKNELCTPVYPWALKAEREVYFCWLLGEKEGFVHPIKALHAICPPCRGVKCHEFLMLNEPINPWVKVLCSASANWLQWPRSNAGPWEEEERGGEVKTVRSVCFGKGVWDKRISQVEWSETTVPGMSDTNTWAHFPTTLLLL